MAQPWLRSLVAVHLVAGACATDPAGEPDGARAAARGELQKRRPCGGRRNPCPDAAPPAPSIDAAPPPPPTVDAAPPPPPPPGGLAGRGPYFPPGSPWYQDISAVAVDDQ